MWQKVSNLDRRWIYLGVAICAALPLILEFILPIPATPPVKRLFDAIENMPPGHFILLSMDFEPSTMPELLPMAYAITQHALSRGIKVGFMTLAPAGPGMIEIVLEDIRKAYPDRKYGEDYVNFGYKPGLSAVILGIGEDIHRVFPRDAYGTPLEDIPMMREIHNYKQIDLVISLSGAGYPDAWLLYANARYGQAVATGATAVMAPLYYAYLATGQFVGMLGGLKGAAEYAELVRKAGYMRIPEVQHRVGVQMSSQSFVHIYIVLLIIIGNIAFFFIRRSGGR